MDARLTEPSHHGGGLVMKGVHLLTAATLAATLALAGCAEGEGGPTGLGGNGEPTRPPHLDVPDPESVTKGENVPAKVAAPYVVIVSLDGFASRYVQQYGPTAIQALAAQGVSAPDGMIPVFPTKTFPNHYSLATGMYPEKHGIVANNFLDPERGAWYRLGDVAAIADATWYRGEPLWVTAEKQGMVAACYFWVGSEAAIGGVRPSYWRTFDPDVPNDARVDQVLAWLRYPPEYRPHLVTLYMHTTDLVGHTYGPDSPEMAAAVASVDASIGRLVAGIDGLEHGDQVTVIVVADHGMDGFGVEGRRYLADVYSLEGLTIPESGPAANIHVEGGAEAAVALRDAVNGGLEGVTAYLRSDVPERLHYRADARIGDVVVVSDSGTVVFPANNRPETPGWTHGWDNALSTMRALFVARGPRILPGERIEPFELVHVYPLMTRILGLTNAPDIDGSPSVWEGILGG